VMSTQAEGRNFYVAFAELAKRNAAAGLCHRSSSWRSRGYESARAKIDAFFLYRDDRG
jgi:hypothetical protein